MKIYAPKDNFLRPQFWLGQMDCRPVDAFRVAFALWLLKDAFYHLFIAGTFYSDDGVLPRHTLLDGVARQTRFSLMDALPHTWMAQAFFLLWMGGLVALLVGYKTRQAAVLNFVLILSVHERNIFILNGADTAMRVFSFWLMFLPIGHYYALDAIQRPKSGYGFAFPVRMLQMQVALVYLTTFLLKMGGTIWREGLGVFYALQLQSLTLPTGDWALEHAPLWMLKTLNFWTLGMEAAFIFLVFIPFLQPALRAFGLLWGFTLHAGIALLMSVPNFSFVMLISYLVFFEPSWIEAGETWLRRQLGIQYGAAHRSYDHEPNPTNNYRALVGRSLMTLTLGVLMFSVVWWNGHTLKRKGQPLVGPPPDALWSTVQYVGLWQGWDMFAPFPALAHGWVTVEGQFEDGTAFDLMTGKAINDVMPRWYAGPSARWKKYVEQMTSGGQPQLLSGWGGHYCRVYNIKGSLPSGQRLATLEIHYHWRASHGPSEPPNEWQSRLLWRHWCYEEYADS